MENNLDGSVGSDEEPQDYEPEDAPNELNELDDLDNDTGYNTGKAFSDFVNPQ